jgi:hypothetical protein
MLSTKSVLLVLSVSAIGILALSGPALGGLVTLGSESLTDLLGPSPVAADAAMVTVMNQGNLKTLVISQAFTNGLGQYVYLYQVQNTGTVLNSPVEMFTVWPFTGATDATLIGRLAGTPPEDFLSTSGQAPMGQAFVKPLGSGPLISFYYEQYLDLSIDPGEHSVVMYISSTLPPDEILGNTIDGSVGSGPVWGPVPEPTTMVLLVAGGAGMLLARRRRR